MHSFVLKLLGIGDSIRTKGMCMLLHPQHRFLKQIFVIEGAGLVAVGHAVADAEEVFFVAAVECVERESLIVLRACHAL